MLQKRKRVHMSGGAAAQKSDAVGSGTLFRPDATSNSFSDVLPMLSADCVTIAPSQVCALL
jgi:hypothetical protein